MSIHEHEYVCSFFVARDDQCVPVSVVVNVIKLYQFNSITCCYYTIKYLSFDAAQVYEYSQFSPQKSKSKQH